MLKWLFDRAWASRNADYVRGPLESVFILRTNKRYRATVTLVGIESWASNGMIEDKFRELGFKDPKVNGSGGTRKGEATWPGKEQSVPLPIDPHLSDVAEVA
jgi:hypothetical protein